ncbi:ferric-chelate reductase (NADH) [Sarracenia purpurea var. burkii]
MSVLIKCEGWWTSSLYNIVQAELASDGNPMKCIPVAIEGPYGPASLDFLRYDSLLLVAGGIGISSFLSILHEIDYFAQTTGRRRIPTQTQLIYVVKKSQDTCLLYSILPLLPNQRAEQFPLKLKVFVTQEPSGPPLRVLLHELSPRVETVDFDTQCSNFASKGLGNLLWMAAIVGFSSFVFIVLLGCFNRAFPKKASKQKYPSSVIDLFLICSFIIASVSSTVVAIVLKRRKLNKECPPSFPKHGKKELIPNSMETTHALEEHEIQYGGRPNFQDVFLQFSRETGGSDIGVFVCGPEAMKESVASLCQMSSQGIRMGAQRKVPYFSFHSLNFTL